MTALPTKEGAGSCPGNDQLECTAIHGREDEQQAVSDLVRRARKGRGGVLLIEGEPGMGKSLLLSEAARVAHAENVSLIAASADELSRFMPLEPPFAALNEAPATLADEATLRGITGLPMWLVAALRARLESRASTGPLVVSMDDLHWADPATLQALRTLPWQLSSYPLSWILARRSPDDGNGSGRLFDLLEGDGATRITLRPLSDDAVARLITDAVGAVPDAGLMALAAGAAGNPQMLTELMGGLWDENGLVIRDGRVGLVSACLPRRIQAMTRRMLERLSAAARHLLEAASVLGRSFRLEDATTLLGTSPAALLPVVQEALTARVLVATSDSLVFRNELVWQAVSEALPLPVRQALHWQFGEALLERGGAAASAAVHLLSGAGSGDCTALAGLDRASAEVLPSSPDIAADLAARALELTPPGDPRVLARSVSAAEALAAAGRPDEAAELARTALVVPQPAASSARLRCALSSALAMSGAAGDALAEAERVLAEPRLSSELRADAMIARLRALIGLRDGPHLAETAQAILAARDGEQRDVVIAALVALAITRWEAGDVTDALDLSSDAVRRGDGLPPDARRFHPHLFLASRLVDLRRFGEARALIRAAPDHIDALAPTGWSATPATLRARMALAEGRLDDATTDAEAALGVTSDAGAHVRDSMAPVVLASVALRHGDVTAAIQHVRGRPLSGAAYADSWGTVIAAQAEEARTGPRAGLEMLAGVYDDLRHHRFLLLWDPAFAAWLTRTALAAGDSGRAAAAAAMAGEIAAGNAGLPIIITSAAHAAGIADGDRGRLEQAGAEHADQWARASALEDLGMLLARTGSADAIASFSRALDDYAAAGAARDVARVRRRLRRLGVRRRHWAAAGRTATGWSSLTATERAISELVSQGLTNQQVADQMFISAHTVAFHLRQIFRKLGISSRVELTRIAMEKARERPRRTRKPEA